MTSNYMDEKREPLSLPQFAQLDLLGFCRIKINNAVSCSAHLWEAWLFFCQIRQIHLSY